MLSMRIKQSKQKDNLGTSKLFMYCIVFCSLIYLYLIYLNNTDLSPNRAFILL